jgi:hypothetical protein
VNEELQEFIDKRTLWAGYEISSNDQVKSIIKNNINQMCNNWISIGFALKQARDKEFYKEDGYSGIQDYAFGEFGIKKQRASKLIKIIEMLSVNGNSPVLEDKWKEFSIAKLEEIIYLEEEERESVQPVMTKVQIRNIGKDDSLEVSPAKLEAECFIKNQIYETGQDELKCSGGISKSCNTCDKSEPREVVPAQPESVKRHDVAKGILDNLMSEEWCSLVIWRRFLEEDIFKKGKIEACKDFLSFHGGQGQALKAENGHPKFEFMLHRSYGNNPGKINLQWDNNKAEMPVDEFMNLYLKYPAYDIKKSDDIPISVNDIPENVDNQPKIVNDVDESVIETAEEVIEDPENVDGNPLSCKFDPDARCLIASKNSCKASGDGCMYCAGGLDNYESDTEEQVETVEADIIQTIPEDPERYTLQDVKDELDKLTEYVEAFRRDNSMVPGRRKGKMRYDAVALLDKEMRKPPVIEVPEPVQPELPVLKNNDQRAEWVRDYISWGVWYQDNKIHARYFKYDLPDGSRIVAAQYKNMRVRYKQEEGEWSLGHYHLIKAGDYFNPYESSQTEIIEHLKQVIPRK